MAYGAGLVKKGLEFFRPGNVLENLQTMFGGGDENAKPQAQADLTTEAVCAGAMKRPNPATVVGCLGAATNGLGVKYGGHPTAPEGSGQTIGERAERIEQQGERTDDPARQEQRGVDARNEAQMHPLRAKLKAWVNGTTEALGDGAGGKKTAEERQRVKDMAKNGEMGPPVEKKDGEVVPGPTTWGDKEVTPEELAQKKAEVAAKNGEPPPAIAAPAPAPGEPPPAIAAPEAAPEAAPAAAENANKPDEQ